MLNVSGVSFGNKAILEREGKYTQANQPQPKTPEMPADSFGKPKKKHTGLKAFLGTLAVVAAATGTLIWAAKAGKLSKIEAPKGFMDHAKNFISNAGDTVTKVYDDVVAWGKGLFQKS